MCLIVEMILFAWGLYAFRNGQFKFFTLIQVEGGFAQAIGAMLMVPLLTCVLGDTILGIVWTIVGFDIMWLFAFAGLQLGIDVLVTLTAFLLGLVLTKRPKVRRRRRGDYA
jgi:hypothetical protein